ncbi:MAG: hypothetical protein RR317_05210 [Bilophila sp.]
MLSSPPRSSRKTDANFAEMLEVRGTMAPPPQASAPSEPTATAQKNAGQQPECTDQVKKQALDALTKLMDSDPSNGGVYKPQGLSAMRTLLSSTLLLPETPANGQTLATPTAPPLAPPSDPTAQKNVPSLVAVSGHVDRIAQPSASEQTRRAQTALQGIALPDRTRGIPIDVRQQRNEAVHNIALNRNRPRQSEAIASTRKTHVSRQDSEGLGALAAQYESGSEGIAAIGYDRTGGTSYGKYQIASRPGSMAGFVSFLQEEAPELAQRLTAAGPANTGSRKGAMPEVWKNIATEQPERFEDLQERFILQSHYEPALNAVRRIGYDTKSFSPAMKEVLYSTAVQHGPSGAASIFAQAAEGVGLGSGASQQRQEKQIINEVYSLRANKFGSSSPQIQAAARQRMESEKRMALALTTKKGIA